MNAAENYLHGYQPEEQDRLHRQARFLEERVFAGIDLSAASHLLEVGCGVGAQTEILLRRCPRLRVTGIDVSARQLEKARNHLADFRAFAGRFDLRKMDATALTFNPVERLDGAFVCWMLEHAPRPLEVLKEIRRVLQPQSRVFVTEVLNSTLFIDPPLPNVMLYWNKYNALQQAMGGDPCIGAKLGNLLMLAGFSNITTGLKTFYLDRRQPGARTAMFDYWTELMLSGAPQLVSAGSIPEDWIPLVKAEMARARDDPGSVFFYSFVLAQADT